MDRAIIKARPLPIAALEKACAGLFRMSTGIVRAMLGKQGFEASVCHVGPKHQLHGSVAGKMRPFQYEVPWPSLQDMTDRIEGARVLPRVKK
jgi:hypothetical protein